MASTLASRSPAATSPSSISAELPVRLTTTFGPAVTAVMGPALLCPVRFQSEIRNCNQVWFISPVLGSAIGRLTLGKPLAIAISFPEGDRRNKGPVQSGLSRDRPEEFEHPISG